MIKFRSRTFSHPRDRSPFPISPTSSLTTSSSNLNENPSKKEVVEFIRRKLIKIQKKIAEKKVRISRSVSRKNKSHLYKMSSKRISYDFADDVTIVEKLDDEDLRSGCSSIELARQCSNTDYEKAEISQIEDIRQIASITNINVYSICHAHTKLEDSKAIEVTSEENSNIYSAPRIQITAASVQSTNEEFPTEKAVNITQPYDSNRPLSNKPVSNKPVLKYKSQLNQLLHRGNNSIAKSVGAVAQSSSIPFISLHRFISLQDKQYVNYRLVHSSGNVYRCNNYQSLDKELTKSSLLVEYLSSTLQICVRIILLALLIESLFHLI
ncbi:uncharacterized protein RJT20DRAFT_53241 [Scheffersomyces xylosifermentans]|uniref:uncharacterized protein n=1 Tax=Scheffersomyces xylosifermentans TaxID=1304137 RepID=UPI00315CAE95